MTFLAFCTTSSSSTKFASTPNNVIHQVVHHNQNFAGIQSILHRKALNAINSRCLSRPPPLYLSQRPDFDGKDDNDLDNNIDIGYADSDDDLFDQDALMEFLDLDDLDKIEDINSETNLDELEELEKLLESQGWKVNVDKDDDEPDSWRADFTKPVIEDENEDDVMIDDNEDDEVKKSLKEERQSQSSSSALEQALLQGVVPAAAGVGSKCLPADFGFDPLDLATKDYFKKVQSFLVNLLPEPSQENESGAALPHSTKSMTESFETRPAALILRDYREIEVRHGRLAMLAAILWPLQEIIDRLSIPNSFGHTTMIYGGVTLPFVSLFMTLVMLLLGYLDIYAASIKDTDVGDAFLPGECFWDPLSILEGAPDSMKRNMQARELNNGRMAMIAVLSYILQEGISHEPLISLPWNQILFEPAFEIPEVQAWLDGQFAGASKGVDEGFIQEIYRELLEENDSTIII
ncbi:hypothetical protein CTEN210_08249 [Chaetoceros tenuissimus]|uniref:Uncharacterized protein n=2 Tax=Chaetoceros tenuissimus TaxID=426638 RepID=A0AAD3CTG0_9STRA|nr:hypothetical protein CTEN210_08249 [Chaetoceros tenuissimus]